MGEVVEMWERHGDPEFKWSEKVPAKMRYRHPRHWHWLRIYCLAFWLMVLAVSIYYAVAQW